jgi:hypothetical protein
MALCFVEVSQAQYLTFGKTSRGDLETKTLLPLATRSDTGYSPVLWSPFDVGTVRLQLNVTAISASDSLDVFTYSSADDSTYTQITSPSFTTFAAPGSQVIVLNYAPKYLKIKYLNRGAAIANTFSLKAVAKK